MGRITHLTTAFLLSLILVGVAIFFFIENDNFKGRFFVFLAIYTFISLFYLFRSLYYLRYKATFNEILFVVFIPLVPIILVLAQHIFQIHDAFIVFAGFFSSENGTYNFFINSVDFLLIPYYLSSNYLIFRTFIRYPFIRFTATSESGLPSKLIGFLLVVTIPILYILTSIFYFENLFLVIFGIIYFYSGVMSMFI